MLLRDGDVMSDKPQRIDFDPDGFEAVFDDDKDMRPCNSCALLNDDVLCMTAPCAAYARTEKRRVHFIRIKVQS